MDLRGECFTQRVGDIWNEVLEWGAGCRYMNNISDQVFE